MAVSRTSLLVGALTLLEAACLLGLASIGPGLLSGPPHGVEVPPIVTAPPRIEFEPLAIVESATARSSIEDRSADELSRSRTRMARSPRKESEHYAAFLGISMREPATLEGAAFAALAGDGPDCEKVAALRALRDSGSPAADDAFVRAILELPDVSTGGDSVPRFALRALTQRGPQDAGARRALERVASGSPGLARDLREAAAAALAAGADG